MSSNESTKVDMGTILSKFRGTNPPMGMGLHGLLDSRGTHHPKSSKVGGAQYLPEVGEHSLQLVVQCGAGGTRLSNI